MTKFMRQLKPETVDALKKEVHRVGGDWPAARSEIIDFETSPAYREGLRRQFFYEHGHQPNWSELVKQFFRLAISRSKCFSSFSQH